MTVVHPPFDLATTSAEDICTWLEQQPNNTKFESRVRQYLYNMFDSTQQLSEDVIFNERARAFAFPPTTIARWIRSAQLMRVTERLQK